MYDPKLICNKSKAHMYLHVLCIWKQFNAPHLHGEFLNASSAILGNAWHSWICPTWQEEIWPSSVAWSFYSQSHKTKEFHICNNEQAQQKQRRRILHSALKKKNSAMITIVFQGFCSTKISSETLQKGSRTFAFEKICVFSGVCWQKYESRSSN